MSTNLCDWVETRTDKTLSKDRLFYDSTVIAVTKLYQLLTNLQQQKNLTFKLLKKYKSESNNKKHSVTYMQNYYFMLKTYKTSTCRKNEMNSKS